MTAIKSPYPKKVYENNARVYKLLANAKRLEILNIIKGREASVKELAEALKIRMPNVSQHLAILSYLRLVKSRREGKSVFYKITDPRIVESCRIFKELRESSKL